MENLLDILSFSDSNGTIAASNYIENEQKKLEEIEHLVKTIDFCDIFSLLISFTLSENNHYLEIKSKKQKNSKYLKLTHRIVDRKNKKIIPETITNYQKIDFGLSQLLEKFIHTRDDFISEALLKKRIKVSLNKNGLEELKEYLLNKKLFSAYQTYILQKMLKNNEEKKPKRKI